MCVCVCVCFKLDASIHCCTVACVVYFTAIEKEQKAWRKKEEMEEEYSKAIRQVTDLEIKLFLPP